MRKGGALRSALDGIRKVKPKGLYSVDIRIKYKSPDTGKMTIATIQGAGIPRLKDIKPKKGETKAAAFKRVTDEMVRSTVFRFVNAVFQGKGSPRIGKGKGPKGRERTLRALRSMKKRRSISFQTKVYREV